MRPTCPRSWPGSGRRRTHRRLFRALPPARFASLALALALGVGPATAAVGADASVTVSYVSLGDSYTAGPLIPDPTGSPLGCLRSTHNYPSLTARAIGSASFTDRSCSGATTTDMTQPQRVTLGTNPPQLSALSARTTVVTLGIGGNDIGFSSVIGTCTADSWSDPFGSPCKDHYTAGGIDKIAAAIAATGPKVAGALKAIHAAAPAARVFVVGYPDILPNTGDGCFPLQPIALGDVPYLRGVEKELNQMLATQAAANGATYVDTYSATIGHDACQPPDDRWVEGEIPVSLAAPWHPNALGEQAMAARVEAAIR